MESITVNSKGTDQASKMNCCITMATKNKRKAAPKTRETKKKNAPALWLLDPKRVARYS